MKNFYLFVALIIGIIFLSPNDLEAQWNHTGPEGGEVRAMCIADNNDIFATPWSGGIYKSTDNGTSWIAVNNGLTEISITVTALGANGSNIYAGTWGNGVFLSTDYGDNWVEVNNSITANKHVEAFAVKGISVFMGSREGFFRTTDNGTSWEQKTGLPSLDVRDIAVLDTIVFVSLWGGNKVYRSTDDGMSWTQASNGITFNLDDPCLSVSGNSIFLGTYSHGVYRSTDNGDNWSEINNGIPATSTVRDFAVSGSNLFAATRGGGIFLTTNNGTSWNPVNSGLPIPRIESLLMTSSQDLFAGTFYKGIFKSTNLGTTWFEANSGFNGMPVYPFTTILNGNGGEILLTGTMAGVYKSTDDGLEWNSIGLDDYWITGITILDSDIFVSTMGSGVYRSTDYGISWLQSGLAGAMLQTIHSNDRDIFVGAAFFGGAQRSTDKGATWVSISGLEYKWMMCFEENDNYIFAGAMMGGVFRSSDNGLTFVPINTGLSDTRVSTLAVMDSIIFAGTGDPNGSSAAGVFRSTNNGDNWSQINNGIPANLMVWSFAAIDNNLFASSSTSGQNKVADVYLTTDLGESWSSVGDGLVSNYINSLFIYKTNIFAGTIGSSSWWRPLSEIIPNLLPSNPSSLVAVADTFGVILNWQDNSDNEDGFIIERKDDSLYSSTPWVIIDTVATDVTAYNNIGLTPNTTYSYRISAYNEAGVSVGDSVEVTTIVPVELTSFSAVVNEKEIILNWATASELNNQGFEIEKQSDSWEKIGFVPGYGTTTEPKSYTFIDDNISSGTNTYRLKQIDYDGTFSYSKEISVEVDLTPTEYTLEQNYPNPFNPNTVIKYSLAQDGFVNIAVFNLLGEKVATLVNTTQRAGNYEVNFNASSFSSGIYFYSMEAGDFKSVRKMLLMK
jgi:photosystem II stability/assembly factor-like uncharacterized protein